MALAAPTISYVDGTGNATNNLAANATAYVTPGNVLTIALQSSTGVQWADLVLVAPGTPLDGYRPARVYSSPFSWSFQLPQQPMSFTAYIEVFDGNNPSFNTNTFNSLQKVAGLTHRARGVCTTAETLATFDSVTGGTIRDGVTYVQGDVVLLVNQATKSQNGLYYVGAVAAGSAPLTRVPDFVSGTVFSAGQSQVCEVSEGTLFANTTWKITTAGAITVDTTNHDWYPREVTQSVTLVAGTVTISNVPILSTSKTQCVLVRTATGGTLTTTIQYCPTVAGANGFTAGIVGTGQVVVQATVAAGTIQNADTSTLAATIINW